MSPDQMEIGIYYSCMQAAFKKQYKFQEGF